MIGRRRRLALTFLVGLAAIVLASGGSAGQREATATFQAFPGPARVTYDELIAYKAEFTTETNSTLTHVRFRQTIPVAEGEEAAFDSSTCPSTPTERTTPSGAVEWICDFGQVPAGTPTLELTIVWRVPNLGDTANCDDCLVSTGRWTVKEGVNDVDDPNDVFGLTTETATVLSAGEGTEETLLAGGYETAAASCAAGNLKTHQVVSLANPVTSKFCLPAFVIPLGDPNLGYASTITETSGNPHVSEICIAELGTNCGETYDDAEFNAPYVTTEFKVAAGALPKGYKIETVSHNGDPLPKCADDPDYPNGCVVSITPPRGNPKIWVIVATSPTNGPWDW